MNLPSQTHRSLDRRRFLKTTSAVALAGGYWSEARAQGTNSANQKLTILCVGTANRAAADIAGVQGEDIVGLCDIDQNYLDRASAKFKDAKTYHDYREMIAAEADKVDAVVVGTTDHHHAPATIRAIQAGLHVYCEKPLTHTIAEARAIAAAA